MPIYEYECPVCGRFELFQKASEAAATEKPDCPEKNCPHKAERVISATAFHLKGSGWYKTDYASSSSSSNSGKKESPKGGSEKSETSDSGKSSDSSSSSESSAKETPSIKKTTGGGGGCGSGCGCH